MTTASKSSRGSAGGNDKQSAAYNPGNNTPRSTTSDALDNMSHIDGECSNSSQLGGVGHNRHQSMGTMSSVESTGFLYQHLGPPSPAGKLSTGHSGSGSIGEAKKDARDSLLLIDAAARGSRDSPSDFSLV